MGIVASLAISPMLIEVARDEELRAAERKRLDKLNSLPGKGFILGDADLRFVKKVQTPRSRTDCCGCPEGDCRVRGFHEDVEKIYLTGHYRPKYEALFAAPKAPKTSLENNFFVQSGFPKSRKFLKAYPNVRLRRETIGSPNKVYMTNENVVMYRRNSQSITKT